MTSYKFRALICILCAAAIMLCGCGRAAEVNKEDVPSESEEVTSAMTTTSAETTTSATEQTTVTTTTAATTTEETTTSAPETEEEQSTVEATPAAMSDYTLTDDDYQLLGDCVFVGDSICHGLEAYKILDDDNVVATGNVAARSIFEYDFDVSGETVDLITGLTILNPKYVIFSMGMNDINITSSETYCENYLDLLTKAQEALPDAKLYVASITPIDINSPFSTNEKIDVYNQAIAEFLEGYPEWGYLDVSKGLKNDANSLGLGLHSGDGIHLSPAAYRIYLGQICEQIRDDIAEDGEETVAEPEPTE